MTTKQPARKRGAQPGNTNALKHGFYANRFEAVELVDYERAEGLEGLDNEIAMLRIITRRMLDLAKNPASIDDMATVLGALGLASTRLAHMLRVQYLLGGSGEPGVLDALNEVIDDVLAEMRK